MGRSGVGNFHHRKGAFRGLSTRNETQQKDARFTIAKRIQEALDPTTAPGKPRTLADMSPEEQAEMRRLYDRSKK